MSAGNGPELMASWSATMRHADSAGEFFWRAVEQVRPGLLPTHDAGLFFAGLGWLVSGVTTRRAARPCWRCWVGPIGGFACSPPPSADW